MKKAFTLIELLVVIAIIAILMAFSFSLSSNRSHCSYAPRLDKTLLSLPGEDFGDGYSRSDREYGWLKRDWSLSN